MVRQSLILVKLICFGCESFQGFLYTPDMHQSLLRTLKLFHYFVTQHQGVLKTLSATNSLQLLTNPRFLKEFKKPAKQQTGHI